MSSDISIQLKAGKYTSRRSCGKYLPNLETSPIRSFLPDQDRQPPFDAEITSQEFNEKALGEKDDFWLIQLEDSEFERMLLSKRDIRQYWSDFHALASGSEGIGLSIPDPYTLCKGLPKLPVTLIGPMTRAKRENITEYWGTVFRGSGYLSNLIGPGIDQREQSRMEVTLLFGGDIEKTFKGKVWDVFASKIDSDHNPDKVETAGVWWPNVLLTKPHSGYPENPEMIEVECLDAMK